MDYHAIHGHDVSSFDLSATREFGSLASQVRLDREPADDSDRLPTVSAAKALQDLERNDGAPISTGLAVLDASLSLELGGAHHGGIQKGHVTEVWGPPGAGKTAFGYARSESVFSAVLTRLGSSSLPGVSPRARESCGLVRLSVHAMVLAPRLAYTLIQTDSIAYLSSASALLPERARRRASIS